MVRAASRNASQSCRSKHATEQQSTVQRMHGENRMAAFAPQQSHAEADRVGAALSRAANAPFIASLRAAAAAVSAASFCAAAAEATHGAHTRLPFFFS